MPDAWKPDREAMYDAVARSYETRKLSNPSSTWSERLLERFLAMTDPALPLLDLGCGHGVEARRMADGGRFVVGLDESWEMLQRARARTALLVRGEATELPFAVGAFAGVWSLHVLLHVPDLRRCLDEVVRVLAPGGLAALTFAVGGGTTEERVPWQPERSRRFVHRPSDEIDGALAASGLVQHESGEGDDGRPTRWTLAKRAELSGPPRKGRSR